MEFFEYVYIFKYVTEYDFIFFYCTENRKDKNEPVGNLDYCFLFLLISYGGLQKIKLKSEFYWVCVKFLIQPSYVL